MFLYFWFSVFSLLFKGRRFIFFLISLEFIVLNLFIFLGLHFSAMGFFVVLCMSVLSSVLGLTMMVSIIKFYGNDNSLF
uniref:NADH dehydrogenase subunit 4L n=1 Tax=Strongyloides venezuelensis TaxID=75913 RepID=A0A0P0YJZ1_STRVS|nr:NADH dehydrogenase subunit 4L [Strongyloides venezuelensis]BAT21224.1 NADH dehydrogenase subunit 4L [Strongyloides venezuelensis]